MRSAFALRIFSGKYILNFGVLKSLRTFQNPFFTEGNHKDTPGQHAELSGGVVL